MPDWLISAAKSPNIVAAILTFILTIIHRIAQPRPKIVWGTSHGFSFIVPRTDPPGPDFLVHTQTVFIQNVGRESASDIEVILNYRPHNLSLWPQLVYSTTSNPENKYIIKIENLGRREFTQIEMLHSVGDMPAVLRIRTPRGECKQAPMAPMQVFPASVRFFLLITLLLGVYKILEWAAASIFYLIDKP